MAVMRMGHSKSIANNTGTASGSGMNPIFHDFLGMSCASDSPVVFAPKTVGHGGDARRSEASPSASASAGASSGGGRGPISTTSDLGSGEFSSNPLILVRNLLLLVVEIKLVFFLAFEKKMRFFLGFQKTESCFENA